MYALATQAVLVTTQEENTHNTSVSLNLLSYCFSATQLQRFPSFPTFGLIPWTVGYTVSDVFTVRALAQCTTAHRY